MGVVVLPTNQPASSLEWAGEYLVDPVGGFRRWRTGDASSVDEPGRSFGGLVDSLAVSPSGRHRVLYTRRGTKAILLDDHTLLRELNRSFAYAEDFDYPIALGRLPDGRDVLAHCPESIGRLRIEDVATGEVLAEQKDPGDAYFHSRLAFSPDGRYLLVNGWFWHPEATVEVHDVAASFADPRALDVNLLRRRSDGAEAWRGEVVSACWLAADRIAVLEIPDTFEETAASKYRRGAASDAGGKGAAADGRGAAADDGRAASEDGARPAYSGATTLSVLGVDGTLHARNRVTVLPGLLAPCGDLVLNLHAHPTLLDPSTGRIVAEWPDLDGGNTTLCYGVNATRHPVFAYEASSCRLALAQPDHIAVLDVQPS